MVNKKVVFINVNGKEEVFTDVSHDNGNKVGDKVKVIYSMSSQHKPYVFVFQEFVSPELYFIIVSSIATVASIKRLREKNTK
ncbi:MAG TPA: hypothetical protein VF941_17545 [Clostridia bacterium]